MTTNIRADVLSTLERFIAGWRSHDTTGIRAALTDDAVLRSSAHGEVLTAATIADTLATDFPAAAPTRIVSTNAYVAGNLARTTLTAYLYGVFAHESNRTEAVFGAVLLANLVPGPDGWVFTDLRLSVTQVEGTRRHFARWQLPDRSGWQVGDPTPIIVSEIDSPWACGVPALAGLSAEQRVVDAYTRYAWAIDQGDIALLVGAYAPDASGEFMPLGHREGRRDIIGQQKAFRRHWPHMQHFGLPLAVTLDDARTASMVVGRVIPQRDVDASGAPLFGARYQLQLVLDDDEWRIRHFDYREGWTGTP
ncbi:nuclear transport factor 2 family protein [Oerskovia enterophila]|uniref:nuclear transport factor 2 family protein n=1 Tax=Oerskovia enterophila TaxID=43678 RepID=UPI0037FD25F6